MRRFTLKTFFLCLFLLISSMSFIFSQQVVKKSASEIYSEEEFRRGVQAFYRGAFNEAILQFEEALSNNPSDYKILDWLGKAYYRSGMESSALTQWEYAQNLGYGGLLLKNKIEVIRQRRITGASFDNNYRYVEVGSVPGSTEGLLHFSQPISVLPELDGTSWVLAYGSNELIKIDVNGAIVKRTRGPLNGFDRPMDIIRLANGNLLITEYAADRISVLSNKGNYIKSFGKRGSGEGRILGPQYLAEDIKTNRVFVSDFGNARIAVFDSNGKSLYTFGSKSPYFSGLKAPTGIAVHNGLVYVADAFFGAIYVFDVSGNYVDILVREKTLNKPEAMKLWQGYLLIADGNKVLTVSLASGEISEIASVGNAPAKITCAAVDVNGNLVVTDVKANEIYVLTKMSELVGGLFVNIEKVDSKNFPNVTVDVRIENQKRQPVVGLKAQNFLITEKSGNVAEQQLVGSGFINDKCDVVIIIDRLNSTKTLEKEIETAVREIASSMTKGGSLKIVSAGEVPVIEMKGNPKSFLNFKSSMLKNSYSNSSVVDLALRLAGNELIVGEAKRAVVYLSSGNISSNAFDKYSYSETAAWLNNNGIIFMAVNLCKTSLPPMVEYLLDSTQGREYYIYRPEGLKTIGKDVCNYPNGLYSLTFKSNLQTDFGRGFLPLEMEVYLHTRSGRDETGYFAPLQ